MQLIGSWEEEDLLTSDLKEDMQFGVPLYIMELHTLGLIALLTTCCFVRQVPFLLGSTGTK